MVSAIRARNAGGTMPKVTNPDALPSDCYCCARVKCGECWLTAKLHKPIEQAHRDHPRCMYWDEVR